MAATNAEKPNHGITKEILGYFINFKWSDRGIGWLINRKNNVSYTPCIALFQIEQKGDKALVFIFFKLSIAIAKL